MSLRLVCGRSGSGKSEFCLNETIEKLNNNKIYIITPEQFSYSVEKLTGTSPMYSIHTSFDVIFSNSHAFITGLILEFIFSNKLFFSGVNPYGYPAFLFEITLLLIASRTCAISFEGLLLPSIFKQFENLQQVQKNRFMITLQNASGAISSPDNGPYPAEEGGGNPITGLMVNSSSKVFVQ